MSNVDTTPTTDPPKIAACKCLVTFLGLLVCYGLNEEVLSIEEFEVDSRFYAWNVQRNKIDSGGLPKVFSRAYFTICLNRYFDLSSLRLRYAESKNGPLCGEFRYFLFSRYRRGCYSWFLSTCGREREQPRGSFSSECC